MLQNLFLYVLRVPQKFPKPIMLLQYLFDYFEETRALTEKMHFLAHLVHEFELEASTIQFDQVEEEMRHKGECQHLVWSDFVLFYLLLF